jgi:hypothetical protein
MNRISIALISEDKNLEKQVLEAAHSLAPVQIRQYRSIIEMLQGSDLKKIQLIMTTVPQSGEGREIGPIHTFLRSKKDLLATPVAFLLEDPDFAASSFLTDERVRAFPLSSGIFPALSTLWPLVQNSELPLTHPLVHKDTEFLESLSTQLDGAAGFRTRIPDDDELRSEFVCQEAAEIRTHLAWYKLSLRLLLNSKVSWTTLFPEAKSEGEEALEALAQDFLARVVRDYVARVRLGLESHGAMTLAPIEKLGAPDRKLAYASVRHDGVIFESSQCQLLLQTSRYI